MTEISVIIPVYNTEKYLNRCIDSVINQTFPDFEIVLVDDGSMDNSCEICDEYVNIDHRIKVIHQKNRGASSARNSGVRISKGRYVTFVDSDDFVENNYLETLYSLVKTNNADMGIASLFAYDDNCVELSDMRETVYENGRRAVESLGAENGYKFKSPCCKLIMRDIVLDHPFPEHVKCGEDFAVVYKWLFASNRVVDKNIPLYHYNRENDESLTRTVTVETFDKHLFDEMLGFFEMNGFEENLKLYAEEYIMNTAIYTNKFAQSKDLTKHVIEMRRHLRSLIRKYGKLISLDNHSQKNYIMRTAYPIMTRIKKQYKKVIIGVKERL